MQYSTSVPPPPTSAIVAATSDSFLPRQAQALARARAFAEPLLASEQLDTGENILSHADAVATRYSVAADVLAVSAIALGGYALYLTLTREPERDAPASSLRRESTPHASAQLELWPGGARVRGAF